MRLNASVGLIDIEGTIGSVAFVRDVLFPFARDRMDAYVREHQDEPPVRALLDDAAREAGLPANDLAGIIRALFDWSDRDIKVTPLKQLQGMIWVEGYESSGLRGHLYNDAIEALRRFHAAGVRLYVYSSGSVAAQRLLFANSVAGDLLPLFSGFFDTTIGGKREAASYEYLAGAIGEASRNIVFFSDNAAELDAARIARLQTVQLARPEDGTAPTATHASVASFDGIDILP